MNGSLELKRIFSVVLGCFWLVDGILQLQPAMFTNAFASTVLLPNLQNQPSVIANLVSFGIHVFTLNIFWSNLAAALIQILIGVLLFLPSQSNLWRFGLWLSVAWAFIVWVFGEGFGNLATGMATFYTGAPGSALLYLIIALALLYSFYKRLPRIAGIVLFVGALLNLAPMFWQPTMLSMLAMVPPISAHLGAVSPQGTIVGNFLAVDALLFLGIFLFLAPNRPVGWVAIIFLIAVWWIGQSFGGLQTFPGGTATDPNSAPLLILFLVPIFFNENAQV